MKPCGILRRIVVVNMRFVTLRYKFTKKQWIYWISWIPDQIFWSLDMAWSQTRTIRSKADRNFNPRKFRGKSIQIYVFRIFFTSHEIFKFTHVFALIEWKSLWFLDSKDHVKILYEGTVFKLTYTILVFSLLVKRSLNLIMQIFLLEFKIVKSEVAEIKVVSLTLYWALTLQAETILILILS